MYKVICNRNALDEWERHPLDEISILFTNPNIRMHLQTTVDCLDKYYGADRDIEKDMGGYTIILYGDKEEIHGEYERILAYHHRHEDEYELEDIYDELECDQRVTFRLYLCSSDYSVMVVLVERSVY